MFSSYLSLRTNKVYSFVLVWLTKNNLASSYYSVFQNIPHVFFPGNRRVWELGFGYGAAWSSLIFMFVALVLLICDRESEELYYKERDVEKSDEFEDDSSSDARWVMEFLTRGYKHSFIFSIK